MTEEGIGAAIRRKEDFRFLVGRGRFIDDLDPPGLAHCFVQRAPVAHARIRAMDTAAAQAASGVLAVFTGADMAADGLHPMRCMWPITSADGTAMAEPERWALARGTARYQGEPVAAVIAETAHQAEAAAELLQIDYAELPAVTASEEALADGAPVLHEEAPGNRVFVSERGDGGAVAAAFEAAAHRVSVEIHNNRLTGAAMEPRGVLAEIDPANGTLILRSATQVPHHIRRLVAEQLGRSENHIRVIAADVGGGFGYKGKHYPEETILAWAACKLGRPVKWIAGRGESFVSDTHARDHLTRAELALDGDGRFLGLKVATLANLGAYVSTFGAAIPGAIYPSLLAGVYKTPAIHVSVTGVFTNTAPTDAYRGAGRPEACLVLERLADKAARRLGLDRAEIRRRNLVRADDMPYATPIGPVYDCGDFPRVFARALALADTEGFAARRAETEAAGRLRGLGMACYVESSGVAPSGFAGAFGARGGFFESARIQVAPDGALRAFLGTQNHGQAHATTFAQILNTCLGVPVDAIEIVEGDTGLVPYGNGTFGSRSIAVGGSALHRAAEKIVVKGRRIAAHLMEASEADIQFADGAFRVSGTDKHVPFADLARAAHDAHRFPTSEIEPGLDETAFYDPAAFAFTNGAHVVDLEVDPETGALRLLGYWVVDDIGTVINPLVVEGQVQGGIAQGIGQALMEHCIYDASGQLITGSFLDYALPRADDLPTTLSETDETQPCTHNPLGAKGVGETGAIGAPAAVVSAVLDALAPLGITDLDMPLTVDRLWRAMREAG